MNEKRPICSSPLSCVDWMICGPRKICWWLDHDEPPEFRTPEIPRLQAANRGKYWQHASPNASNGNDLRMAHSLGKGKAAGSIPAGSTNEIN
jgi:hypothetical protein